MLQVRITGLSELAMGLKESTDRMRNMVPVWKFIYKDLMDWETDIFMTEGRALGVTWPSLEPWYAAWKAANSPSNHMLVLSGQLMLSVTVPGASGQIIRMGKRDMTFGTRVRARGRTGKSYFHNLGAIHQYGLERKRGKVRRFFPSEPDDIDQDRWFNKWLRWTAEWIVEGKINS